MVYKKIGNKIPSLSALILAGMLIPCVGCDDGNTQAAAEAPQADADASLNNNNNRPNSENQSSRPPYFINAYRAIYRYIADSILHLNRLCTPPRDVSESDFLGQNAQANLKKLIEAMATAQMPYPNDFRFLFEKLSAKHFKGEFKQKMSWAKFFILINHFYRDLHEFTKGVMELVQEGRLTEAERQNKLKELDNFAKTRIECEENLKDKAVFLNAKESSIEKFDGPRFIRYILHITNDGNDKKNKDYTKLKLLDQSLSIWIKGKPIAATSVAQNNSNDAATITRIQEGFTRGSSIPSNAKVEDGPKILKEIPGISLSDVVDKSSISYLSLVFTLFNGNGPLDFINVSRSERENLEVKVHHKNFNTLLNFARDFQSGEKTKSEFAAALASHINGDSFLSSCFEIPNLTSINAKIYQSISLSELQNQSASDSGTTFALGTDLETMLEGVPSTSIGVSLYRNLVSIITNSTIGTVAEAISKQDTIPPSPTLEQKIAMSILGKIKNAEDLELKSTGNISKLLLTSSASGSAKRLVTQVEAWIRHELDQAVLYQTQNPDGSITWKHTSTTQSIVNVILELDNGMKNKLKATSLTYSQICKEADVPDFHNKLKEIMRGEVQIPKNLLGCQVEELLTQGKSELTVQDQSKYLPNIDLSKRDSEIIDNIMKEYRNNQLSAQGKSL